MKRNGDASIDVWVGEVWIHFPAEGKVRVDSGAAPGDAVGSDPEVGVEKRDVGTAVICRGKAVLIKPDGSTVIVPEKPRDGTSRRFRMRRARG